MSDDFRLPESVKPKHYTLRLAVDLDQAAYTGTVSIDLQVAKPTKTITLNAVDLDIKSATVEGVGSAKISLDPKRERASFTLPQPLKPGFARLTLEFNAKLSSTMRGFYKSTYTRPDGTQRLMATTQFESTAARRAFPCFDEPELKATYDVTLVIPPDRVAVSNARVVREEIASDGRKAVTFGRTPVMSTYLLAFIVGEFDSIEAATKDGTLVRVYATPGRASLCKFALDTAVRGVEFFSEYYAIPYKDAIDKVDLIAVPDFEAGAMENWGAITFREILLFIDPEKSSLPIRRRVAEVVLHELAHQWFGNLVTMKWWSELWLNESFATFMAYKATDALFPEWNIWEEYLSGITSGGKSLDSLRSSHPVEVPVKNPGEVDQIFDAISYNKGGSLLRMLEATIGSDAFRDGIRRYLHKHRYANASTRDLWNALSEGTKWDVARMMAGWTGQTGFPVVIARRKNGKVHLRQERFLLDRNPNKPAEDPTVWTIPLGNGLKMEKRNVELPVQGKLNAGQAGFFLVHYDSALRQAIQPMTLPAADRYGLVEDATSLMRAGYLSVREYLEFVGAFAPDENYHVWSQIAAGVGMLADIFVGDACVPKLQEWAQKLYRPIVDKVGWDKRLGEGHDRALLRATVIGAAARFGDPAVVEEARRRFSADQLDADLRAVVYQAVARHGDDSTLSEIFSRYERADLPEQKVQLLQAMGGFRLESSMRRAFAYALTEKVRAQDAFHVLAATPIDTRPVAWALVKEYWKLLDERYGKSGMIARFIQLAASGIPSLDHAKDVEKFFKKNPAPYATERIKQTVEGVRVRAAFRQRNAGTLAEFFGEKPAAAAPARTNGKKAAKKRKAARPKARKAKGKRRTAARR